MSEIEPGSHGLQTPLQHTGETVAENRNVSVVSLEAQSAKHTPLPEWLTDAIETRDRMTGGLGSIYFEVEEQDIPHVQSMVTAFFDDMQLGELKSYDHFTHPEAGEKPNVGELLILAANIVRHGTGEHDDSYGLAPDGGLRSYNGPLRNHLDFKSPPGTVCRYYSRLHRAVFEILANQYNPEVLATHRLMNAETIVSADLGTLSNMRDVSDVYSLDIASQQRHAYSTLVSYDEKTGLQVTPIDAYHVIDDRLPNSARGLRMLDFSNTRAVDAHAYGWIIANHPDARYGLPTNEDMLARARASLQMPGSTLDMLNNALLIAQAANIARDGGSHFDGPAVPRSEDADQFTGYVNAAITDALEQGIDIGALELVSLAKLLDYSAACGVEITTDNLHRAEELVQQIGLNPLLRARKLTSGDLAARFAKVRAQDDRIWLPEYENDASFDSWKSFKVSYYQLLAAAGITEWAERLPQLSLVIGDEHSNIQQFNLRPNLPRGQRYQQFIRELSDTLANNGFGDTARTVSNKINS